MSIKIITDIKHASKEREFFSLQIFYKGVIHQYFTKTHPYPCSTPSHHYQPLTWTKSCLIPSVTLSNSHWKQTQETLINGPSYWPREVLQSQLCNMICAWDGKGKIDWDLMQATSWISFLKSIYVVLCMVCKAVIYGTTLSLILSPNSHFRAIFTLQLTSTITGLKQLYSK